MKIRFFGAVPSIQVKCRQGFNVSSRSWGTTPRTHFLPALTLARSNAACNATDHLSTVLGRSRLSSPLVRYCIRQLRGFCKASR